MADKPADAELMTRYQDTIMRYVRPRTVPVAICLLESKDMIPDDAVMMTETLNITPTLCQLVAFARYEEALVASVRPEQACSPAMNLIGMVKVDLGEGLMTGQWQVGVYCETLEASQFNMQGGGSPLQTAAVPGEDYEAIVLSPLCKAPYVPDTVFQYCNPAESLKLTRAYQWKTGGNVDMLCNAKGGMCTGIARSIVENRPIMANTAADRALGLTPDDELGFLIPGDHLQSIVDGLEGQVDNMICRHPPGPSVALATQVNLGADRLVGKTWGPMLEQIKKKYGG